MTEVHSWPDAEPDAVQVAGWHSETCVVAARFGSAWAPGAIQAGLVSAVRYPMLTWDEATRWLMVHGFRPASAERIWLSSTPDLYLTLAGHRTWRDRPTSSSVYFIQLGSNGPIKIGKAGNPRARLRELQTAAPGELHLLAAEAGDEERERELHRRFESHRMHGEWFEPSDELLSYIGGLA